MEPTDVESTVELGRLETQEERGRGNTRFRVGIGGCCRGSGDSAPRLSHVPLDPTTIRLWHLVVGRAELWSGLLSRRERRGKPGGRRERALRGPHKVLRKRRHVGGKARGQATGGGRLGCDGMGYHVGHPWFIERSLRTRRRCWLSDPWARGAQDKRRERTKRKSKKLTGGRVCWDVQSCERLAWE